jgi:hypothetical protein
MNYERCQNGCQFRLPKEITPNLEEKKKKKKKRVWGKEVYQGNKIMCYMQA